MSVMSLSQTLWLTFAHQHLQTQQNALCQVVVRFSVILRTCGDLWKTDLGWEWMNIIIVLSELCRYLDRYCKEKRFGFKPSLSDLTDRSKNGFLLWNNSFNRFTPSFDKWIQNVCWL